MAIAARKAQEEMALDLMLLEEALATTKNEEEDKLRRKVSKNFEISCFSKN